MIINGINSIDDLKVGMRVLFDSDSRYYLIYNELATIKHLRFDYCEMCLEFDNIVDGGHTCEGKCIHNHGRLISFHSDDIYITVIENSIIDF